MEIIKAISFGFGALSSVAVIALAVIALLAYQRSACAGLASVIRESHGENATATGVQMLSPKFGDNLVAKAKDGGWHPAVVTDVDGDRLTVAVYVGEGKFEMWDIPVDMWGFDWKWPEANRAAIS